MTAASNRRLVLVIDTDPSFAEDTRTLLADERVLAVRSVEEAAEIVVGGRVDLALLGPSFGNEAGVLSAALLRETDPGLTAVLVANIVTNRILLASLRAGLVDVVDTPLTQRKLLGLLDRVPGRVAPAGVVLLDGPAEVPEVGTTTVAAPVVPPVSEPAPESAAETPPAEPVAPTPEAPTPPPPAIADTAVTVTFEAASSLSTPVAFIESEAEVAEVTVPEAAPLPPQPAPPPVAETPTRVDAASPDDAWAIPIESLQYPDAPDAPPSSAEAPESDRHAVQPDMPAPAVGAWDVPSGEAAWAATTPMPEPPPPPPPSFAEAAPPPMPPTPPVEPPPAPPGTPMAREVWADSPPPPAYDPPRRPPVDLEGIGVLPADGRRRTPFGSGHVVAVMAGKGGSGKTITATNLAMALTLQRGEDSVVVVDADLQFGDVALMLQLDPTRTLADAVSRIDELTDARLDGMLLRHESGLRVMAAPLAPTPPDAIPAKGVVEVVERLRGLYEIVIVDTPPIFDDHLVTVLECADEVLVVVDMDLPSVKNAKIALDVMRAGRFPMERVRLVVNRANAKARLDLVELERSLGLRVAGSIPSDRLIPQSVNEGIPVVALSPRSRVARSFHALAGLINVPGRRSF